MATIEGYYLPILIVQWIKLKLKNVYEEVSSDKEMFNFSNYSKCYNISNKLVIDKMKDETAGVAIKEFVG